MSDPNVLLKVDHVKKWFPVRRGIFSKVTEYVKAVDGVSLEVHAGHTLGIVGESGCGKSTLARVIMGLIPPTEGVVYFEGQDMTHADRATMHRMRRDIQIIFQDPYASLNPRQRVSSILTEPYEIHHLGTKQQAMDRAKELLDLVGLPQDSMRKFPHEFSGGQRQRLCIARALAVNPKLIVCDECVSALDVSIQAQIINLLKELQEQYKFTYLFISHDLSVVEHISDTVGVMYLGNLVEYGATEDIFKNPLHPYTKALFSAIPVPDPTAKMNRIVLEGSIPSPANPPAGCKFHTRCAQCMEQCKTEVPEQREIEPGHFVVCHLYDQK